MSIEHWLSVDEISQHLGVSKETIYRWLERKQIPAHRVGKLWKFKASEVDDWIRNGGASSNSLRESEASRLGARKTKKNGSIEVPKKVDR